MSSVATRSREIVSQGLLEQLDPVIQLYERVRRQAVPAVDVTEGARRLRAGRPALDAGAILREADELSAAFAEAVKAFERAGLATTAAATALRHRNWPTHELALGWLAGERAPRDPVANLARRAVALVAGAVLRGAADVVRAATSVDGWERPVCPCCGGAPDFALVHAAGRTLVCARCDSDWVAPRAGCLGCGADRAPTIARVRSPYLGYTLTICHACGRYLKERPGDEPCQPLVERALTSELDAAAERRGLRI